jgi:hypothetical protein
VIADATFESPRRGVRRLRFVPRAPLPLDAACRAANGIRETLRTLFGRTCELDLGEPVALGSQTWSQLVRDAQLFLIPGRPAGVVLIVPRRDARRLVLHVFGEAEAADAPAALDAACSTLELQAVERIAGRCAPALGALGAAPGEGSQRVRAAEVPACVAYFDLRIRSPIELTLGVGVVQPLPEPRSAECLSTAALDGVGLEVRAVFAEGLIDAADFVTLRPGDLVKFDTKVGALASLNLGSGRLAMGVAGVVSSRTAFLCRDLAVGSFPS